MKKKKQKNKKLKTQKREIIIKEYTDGLFEMECPLFWKLEKIPKDEINDLCSAWVSGELKEESAIKLSMPKMLIN